MTYTPEWYQANKARIDGYNKAWKDANPEKATECQRNWRAANEGHTYQCPSGYVKYIGFEHPATTPCGVTNEHRIVLWDKLNGQDVPCHWCGKQLFWTTDDYHSRLVADHVNTVKNDNRPENLVPSCQKCNITREGGQNRTPVERRDCAFEGCGREAKALGWCSAHYNQQYVGQEMRPLKDYEFRAVSDTHRQCRTCEKVKPNEDFYLRSNKKTYQSECKPCMRQRNIWNKAKRAEANAES